MLPQSDRLKIDDASRVLSRRRDSVQLLNTGFLRRRWRCDVVVRVGEIQVIARSGDRVGYVALTMVVKFIFERVADPRLEIVGWALTLPWNAVVPCYNLDRSCSQAIRSGGRRFLSVGSFLAPLRGPPGVLANYQATRELPEDMIRS